MPTDSIVLRPRADHINIVILQTMVSGIPLYWALESECEILMFMSMWSFGPLSLTGNDWCRLCLHGQLDEPAAQQRWLTLLAAGWPLWAKGLRDFRLDWLPQQGYVAN